MVKHLTTMQETQVQSLGQEDPLEKEMATHSSILAWRIPCIEEPGRLQSSGYAGLYAPNAGQTGSIPGWETKILYVTQHGQK